MTIQIVEKKLSLFRELNHEWERERDRRERVRGKREQACELRERGDRQGQVYGPRRERGGKQERACERERHGRLERVCGLREQRGRRERVCARERHDRQGLVCVLERLGKRERVCARERRGKKERDHSEPHQSIAHQPHTQNNHQQHGRSQFGYDRQEAKRGIDHWWHNRHGFRQHQSGVQRSHPLRHTRSYSGRGYLCKRVHGRRVRVHGMWERACERRERDGKLERAYEQRERGGRLERVCALGDRRAPKWPG